MNQREKSIAEARTSAGLAQYAPVNAGKTLDAKAVAQYLELARLQTVKALMILDDLISDIAKEPKP